MTTTIKPSASTQNVVASTFFKDKRHDFFFIKEAQLFEQLTNGKVRHRLTLFYKKYIDRERDIEKLTNEQVKEIERKYLK